MPLEQDLRSALTQALKQKDRKTADVIRMITTKITERRTQKGFSGELTDEIVEDVIASYRKSLVKARDEYAGMGARGQEQVEALAFEISVCERFLPAPLTEDEIRAAVRAAIADLGAKDPKMAGRVVGAVMKAHKGRADAATVKRITDSELS